VLTEDYTPDLADGFDDGREEIAPGVRLFLLEAAPETEQGLRAIALADHPNGEVVSGWLPSQPQSRGRMIVQVCELGDVTRAALERVWALAILMPGETVAAVYELAADVDAPQIPTIRRWTFDATYTTQPFAPVEGVLYGFTDNPTPFVTV